MPTHHVLPVYNGPCGLQGVKFINVLSITIQENNVVPNVTLDWDSKG